MKNISYFNVCEQVKPKGLLENIKIGDVFHHPVQAQNMNFNLYNYILYYQLNLLYFLPTNPASDPYKIKYSICNGGVGTVRQRNSCTLRRDDT